jgi:hypothetical protein
LQARHIKEQSTTYNTWALHFTVPWKGLLFATCQPRILKSKP